MKTFSAAAPALRATTTTRLRLVAAVGAVIPLLALGACSTEAPVTSGPVGTSSTAPDGATPDATSALEPTPSTTASETAPTPSATPAATATTAKPRTKQSAINAVIRDSDLGHTITATKITRNLPYPAGNPVAASSFEIVGVKVVLRAGTRYSATLSPTMLSLVAADPKQDVKSTKEFDGLFGTKPLPTAKRGEKQSGWLFFKVDAGTSSALTLAYHRPAYKVSTTGKSIPARNIGAVLTQ